MDSTQAFADELGKLQQDDLVMAGFTAHNLTSGAPVAEFLRLQLVGASGAILARNRSALLCIPKTFRFRPLTVTLYDPLNQLQNLRAALKRHHPHIHPAT
jgi:hypothetical protein